MRIKKAALVLPALCGAICVGPSWSFETQTHTVITKQAYNRSTLVQRGVGSVYSRLGFDRLGEDQPFNTYWTSPASFGFLRSDQVPLSPDSPEDGREWWELCNASAFRSAAPPNLRFADVFINGEGVFRYPLDSWLISGVVREDDVGPRLQALGTDFCKLPFAHATMGDEPRVRNHFYDPIVHRGLAWPDLQNVPEMFTACGGVCPRSVDWALGFTDSLGATPEVDAARNNGTSYVDARNAYWWALTYQSPREPQGYGAEIRALDARKRLLMWATTFRSLGHVVHLLQDVAQPQHTRNDVHTPLHPHRTAFEGLTDVRVTGGAANSRRLNADVRSFFGQQSAFPFSPPEIGNYPAVRFATPQRYFSTRSDGTAVSARAGLADYTNRGFFTQGTLPGDSSYAQPPQSLNASDGFSEVQRSCLELPSAPPYRTVTCKHYTRAVPDSIAPAYSDLLPEGFEGPKIPLASESLWARITEPGGYAVRTAMSPEDFAAMGNLVLVRAIGYTTGFIDFFFRGRLRLSPPPGGIYAIQDHAVPHSVSSEGIPSKDQDFGTFGFTKLRVGVQNETYAAEGGVLVESGTGDPVRQDLRHGTLSGSPWTGQLVAIARYHRSKCYRADLQGEYAYRLLQGGGTTVFVPSGCNAVANRTSPPEISVSEPISIGNNGEVAAVAGSACANINKGEAGSPCASSAALLEFDFSGDAIPINATDLFIQVAYRGPIGEELDGIAVGSIDVREPSYYSIANNADFYYYQNQLTPFDDVPFPPRPAGPDAKRLTGALVCVNGQRIAAGIPEPANNAPGLLRIAMILGEGAHDVATKVTIGGRLGSSSTVLFANIRQSDYEAGPNITIDPMRYFRDAVLGMEPAAFMLTDPGSTPPPPDVFAELSAKLPALGSDRGAGLPYPMTVTFPTPDVRCTGP